MTGQNRVQAHTLPSEALAGLWACDGRLGRSARPSNLLSWESELSLLSFFEYLYFTFLLNYLG